MTEHAHVNMSLVALILRKQDFFADVPLYDGAAVDESTFWTDWPAWIQREERRRATYFAWVCFHR